MAAISANAGAGSNARSVTARMSASLSSKTRKIVPSATAAASAICRVVTPGPCQSTSGKVAAISASRRSAGGIRRARSLRTDMVITVDECALTKQTGWLPASRRPRLRTDHGSPLTRVGTPHDRNPTGETRVKPFVINKHGRLVFPATVLGELDFSVLHTLDQFTAVIGRDFESKAPTGTDIRKRVETGAYTERFGLLRDLGQNLFWVNRYSMTMFDKRPTRWRDLPRRRADVFLPVLTPWEDGEAKVAAVEQAWNALPPSWNTTAEQEIFDLLFDLYRHKRHHASELPAVKPTVAQFLERPGALTWVVPDHDPDYPVFGLNDILDAEGPVPELEALKRWAMVLHNQYPWDRSRTELRPASEIGDDDWVIAFHPRNRDVVAFLDRVTSGAEPVRAATQPPAAVPPIRAYPAVRVAEAFRVQPRIEALAVARGEIICDNADVVRNASFSWSPMSADEIRTKTGIAQRRYTAYDIDHLSLEAAKGALAHAGRSPEEIGAVLVATCTSGRLIPSLSTGLSGELGILQTHCSADIVAACAGFPDGLWRRRASCRRSSVRCCWSASRSSPTRSAPYARPG